MKKKIAVVGGGLVGSLLSVGLAKKGYTIDIYERNEDIRTALNYGGRSINLAMSDRGLNALKHIGMEDKIRAICIPMYRRVMHDKHGNLTYQPYGKENQAINSISRTELNRILIEEADKNEHVNLHFNKKCTVVNLQDGEVSFEDDHNNEDITVKADIIIGSDGAFSAIRNAMQKTNRFNYSQDYLDHGYKELTIPAQEDGSFKMEKNALHIWPRGQYMLIALPNLDGSFTCTLFFPFVGKNSFDTINSPAELLSFFNEEFPDVVPLMPQLVEDFFNNPTPPLVTVKCFPWVKGNFALIGDASHAIVPFYGQGMNCGFEDCFILDTLLDQHNQDWTATLEAYQQVRKPDADAISDLAKYNFIEMRDLTGNKDFLLRKQIESEINKKYPSLWIPLYTMVTFSPEIRYSDALKISHVQNKIMEKIMNNDDVETQWNTGKLWPTIDHQINKYKNQLEISNWQPIA